MEVFEIKKEQAIVLELKGRFDSSSAPDVEAKIEELLANGTANLILDFSKLEYISSAGIRILVQVSKDFEKKQGAVILACVPKAVENVLYITGFLPYFKIYESADKALLAI
ncbi:MAG: putative anti-sigma factor antagonist BtrV [Chlamydiales bacterium]|nr:putative anti-sigma factor antagonist BtrV [Chlamydiales bacterium]MCH9635838.1 putative anti-sigma factor antagonist BtrV [Chlamydiales bacterium]MCH9704140.1 STAS domain-containing protein [Chlamydiota bacterium]